MVAGLTVASTPRALHEVLHQRSGLFLLSKNFADLLDRAEHAIEIVWIGDEHRDVLFVQLLREDLELRRGGDQTTCG